jgi:lichenan operon transcriptional antiterminator
MLNELDQKILNALLSQENFISGQHLAEKCGVAVNTIRKEITLINAFMKEHGCSIQAQKNQGFSIVICDHEAADTYLEQLHARCKRNERLSVIHSGQVQYLIRTCLVENGHLTVEQLCDRLYCSQSTLLRALKQVKEELAAFGLELVNKRGDNGLRVIGNEWDIRQCLIYQHKVWTLSLEKDEQNEYGFCAQFMMLDGQDWFEKIRNSLVEELQTQQNFTIPFMSVTKLVHYVELASSRRKYVDSCSFTADQIKRVQNTEEYAFIKQWIPKLPKRLQCGETDMLGLAMLMLSYETQNFCIQRKQEYTELKQEQEELKEYMNRYWGYGEEFLNSFGETEISAMYAEKNRQFFHVYQDTEHLALVQHKAIGTMDLCICFGKFIQEKYGYSLPPTETESLFYLFQRISRKTNAHRDDLPNLMVMSRYGFIYAESLATKIRELYAGRIGQVGAREFCHCKEEDFLTCDLLVTDIPVNSRKLFLPSMSIPTIELEFELNIRSYPQLDRFLNEREQEMRQRILPWEHVQYVDVSTKEELYHLVGETGMIAGWSESRIIEELRQNDQMVNTERKNGMVFLPLFTTNQQPIEMRILINRSSIHWTGETERIFVCYSRMPSKEANLILNDILKQLLYLQPEAVEQLSEEGRIHTTKELWNLLYTRSNI